MHRAVNPSMTLLSVLNSRGFGVACTFCECFKAHVVTVVISLLEGAHKTGVIIL